MSKQAPVVVCRHCKVRIRREQNADGSGIWLHSPPPGSGNHKPENIEYWYCRTGTVAGPRVYIEDAQGNLEPAPEDTADAALEAALAQPFPACPDHVERQHRDGKPPWCKRCGWTRGTKGRPAAKQGASRAERDQRREDAAADRLADIP